MNASNSSTSSSTPSSKKRGVFTLGPVLLLLSLFVLDKIFLLPEVRDNFIQPGGMMYYRQRAEQIESFKTYLKDQKAPAEKVVAVFGDSRSFAAGDLVFKYLGYKDWTVFNFAGPQALPVYHYYLAGKMFRNLRRPDYLIIGISPDAFNRNAGIMASPNLNFGVDDDFIRRNRLQIPEADYEAYVASRRYALVGLGFSAKTFFQRLRGELSGKKQDDFMGQMGILMAGQNPDPAALQRLQTISAMLTGATRESFELYSLAKSPQGKILKQAKGGQYKFFGAAPLEKLKRDSERLKSLYFKRFVVSSEQLYFFEETLRLAQQAGIRTLVYWPQVNPFLKELYKDLPAIQNVWRRVEEISERHGAISLNFNQAPLNTCKKFYDASHMSFDCFIPIVHTFVREFENQNQ